MKNVLRYDAFMLLGACRNAAIFYSHRSHPSEADCKPELYLSQNGNLHADYLNQREYLCWFTQQRDSVLLPLPYAFIAKDKTASRIRQDERLMSQLLDQIKCSNWFK